MSRQTPISISSESESPIAVTTTSASDPARAISFDCNPDVALVSEITIVFEEDDGSLPVRHHPARGLWVRRSILEAEAQTARARREVWTVFTTPCRFVMSGFLRSTDWIYKYRRADDDLHVRKLKIENTFFVFRIRRLKLAGFFFEDARSSSKSFPFFNFRFRKTNILFLFDLWSPKNE